MVRGLNSYLICQFDYNRTLCTSCHTIFFGLNASKLIAVRYVHNFGKSVYCHLVVLQPEGYAQLSAGFNEESIDTIIIDHIYGEFDPTFVEIDHEINSPPFC